MGLLSLRRLGQATALTATVLAASGILGTTECPMITAIEDVALNLVAAQSEAEELREKVTAAVRYRARVQSVAGRRPDAYSLAWRAAKFSA
jgi:hypothetical protein